MSQILASEIMEKRFNVSCDPLLTLFSQIFLCLRTMGHTQQIYGAKHSPSEFPEVLRGSILEFWPQPRDRESGAKHAPF